MILSKPSVLNETDFQILIRLLSFFVIIGINIFTIFWILNMERKLCKCSENWKRSFIKYYLILTTSISVFLNLYAYTFLEYMSFNMTIIFGVSILNIVNMILSIYYISDLIKDKCECSEDIIREIYYYQQYIYSIIMSLFLVFFVFLIIIWILFSIVKLFK